jgi:hypothetical protein
MRRVFVIIGCVWILLAFPIACFIQGYSNISDPNPTTLDRIFLGAIWIVLGILYRGVIPQDASGRADVIRYNVWPLAGMIALPGFILLVLGLVMRRRSEQPAA